ncbi:hypothetical protein EEL31_08440 [Brevibacillus laterosporus]|nr:hypothetical protein EEL31_08440 [Brevibacillus laterosporus]
MQNSCHDSEWKQKKGKKYETHHSHKTPLSQYMLYWLALYGNTEVSLVFYSISLLLWVIWNVLKIHIGVDSTLAMSLRLFFPLVVLVQFCIIVLSLLLHMAWNQNKRIFPYIFRYKLQKEINRMRLEVNEIKRLHIELKQHIRKC